MTRDLVAGFFMGLLATAAALYFESLAVGVLVYVGLALIYLSVGDPK